tara:strand:- start:85 stop:234 length:150 start_codon:yes stop_codon:yes gene_type:complete
MQEHRAAAKLKQKLHKSRMEELVGDGGGGMALSHDVTCVCYRCVVVQLN